MRTDIFDDEQVTFFISNPAKYEAKLTTSLHFPELAVMTFHRLEVQRMVRRVLF